MSQSVRCIFSKTFYFLAPFHPHFAVTKLGEVPESFTMGQSIALKSPAITAALRVLCLQIPLSVLLGNQVVPAEQILQGHLSLF